MYAVIASGGKQYKVAVGQHLKLEKLDVESGAVKFDKVLMVVDGDDVNVGAPYVEKATVAAEVVKQGRHKKVNIIKFRRRKHSMKQQGHRQDYTEVQITDISFGSKSAAAKKPAEKKPAEKKPAAKKTTATKKNTEE